MQRHSDKSLRDGVSMELAWFLFWQYACDAGVSDSNETIFL